MSDRGSFLAETAPQRSLFGPFEIDHGTGELSKSGRPVKLAPQPSRVLILLVRRAGEIVTREEIQKEVWSDTVVEFDQGLNYCIRQIRMALDEDAKEPQYIETVPKRGYRFIAHVAPAADTEAASGAASRSNLWRIAAAAGAIIAVLASVWLWKLDPQDLPPEANDYFQQAESLVDSREPENVLKAKEYYELTINDAPEYAPAWAGLAKAELGPPWPPSQSAMESSERHARHAIRLDQRLARARVALAHSLTLQHKWEEAESNLKTALGLDPNFWEVHHIYAVYLNMRGKGKEALQRAKQARDLAPAKGIVYQQLATSSFHAKDYEGALTQADTALTYLKHHAAAYNWIIRSNAALRRWDAVFAAIEEAEHAKGWQDYEAWRAYAFAGQGRPDRAWEVLDSRREKFPERSSLALASALLALGNRDEALSALEQALDQNDGQMQFLKAAPEFESLHSEPRFQAILRRLGNP